ncbi:MAG: hypothetical protein WDA00_04165 [Eubacteriales bacterium]
MGEIPSCEDVVYETYASTRTFLAGLLLDFKTTLMTQAETFHNSLYTNGVHVTNLVDTYYIHAVSGVRTNLSFHHELYMVGHIIIEDLSLSLAAKEGDSLVPKWSAALAGAAPYHDRIYRMEGVDHMSIIYESTGVHKFIIANIVGSAYTQTNVEKGYQ